MKKEKFVPFEGFGTGNGVPYPNPGPMAGGGIGSMGFQTWLSPMSTAVDRLEEVGDAEADRLSGIEKIWSKIVSWFYSGKEPERKVERVPDYLRPGTVANNVFRAQHGLRADEYPLHSTETIRDPDSLFYRKAEERHKKAEERDGK